MVCALYDFPDFTIGVVIPRLPFLGELVGCAMFGKEGTLYGLEGIDLTEQFDGFIPSATLIAIRKSQRATASWMAGAGLHRAQRKGLHWIVEKPSLVICIGDARTPIRFR
jgi:hypothetical protein